MCANLAFVVYTPVILCEVKVNQCFSYVHSWLELILYHVGCQGQWLSKFHLLHTFSTYLQRDKFGRMHMMNISFALKLHFRNIYNISAGNEVISPVVPKTRRWLVQLFFYHINPFNSSPLVCVLFLSC